MAWWLPHALSYPGVRSGLIYSLHHKAGHTLRKELVRPKDKLEIHEKCGVVYETECGQCGESYIGETGRSMGERAEEHDKSIRKRGCRGT